MGKTTDITAAYKRLPARKLVAVSDLTTDIYTCWRDTTSAIDGDKGDESAKVSSARSRVLGNDDLLHEIFQHCPRQDIQSLRLCSRLFESVASHYLFYRLTIGFRKRYVRRLERVAAIEKFSKGVHELVWERVSYGAPLRWEKSIRSVIDAFGVDQSTVSEERIRRAVSKAARFAKDQTDMKDDIISVLGNALCSFGKIQRVEITQWARTGQNFWDLEALLGESERAPLPLQTLFKDPASSATENTIVLLYLLRSLAVSKHQIEDLTIQPTSALDIGFVDQSSLLPWFPFPGMTACFRPETRLLERGKPAALRSLRNLHLDLSVKDVSSTSLDTMNAGMAREGIRELFSTSRQLEDIFIRLYSAKTYQGLVRCTCIIPLSTVFDLENPYSALRRLHLDSFWLEAPELCKLIEAHAPTLKYLTLKDINLGDTQEVERVLEDVALLRVSRLNEPHECQGPSHPEWSVVAEVCRKVPNLSRLLIESPSVTADWWHLRLWETGELMKTGIGGKNNELYDNGSWDTSLG